MLLPGASVADEDETNWLVTFSDLVLLLFAMVAISFALERARTTSRPEPRPVAPASSPVRARQAVPPKAEPPARLWELTPIVAPPRPVSAPEGPPEPARARSGAVPVKPGRAAQPLATSAGNGGRADRRADPVAPSAVKAIAGGRMLAALPPPPVPAPAPAQQVADLIAAAGLGEAATVTIDDSTIVLAISDTIAFESGRADLLPDALAILDEVRAFARDMPGHGIDVAGHTDDVPIRSADFPSNLDLSVARAARVARALVAGDADLARRTVASGFGEFRPLESNADPAGRARNRRVEIRFVPLAHSKP